MSTPMQDMVESLTEASYNRFMTATTEEGIAPREAMREIVSTILLTYNETLDFLNTDKEEGRKTS